MALRFFFLYIILQDMVYILSNFYFFHDWIALQYFGKVSNSPTHSVSVKHFFFFFFLEWALFSLQTCSWPVLSQFDSWLLDFVSPQTTSCQFVHIFNYLESGFRNNVVHFAEIDLLSISVVKSFRTDRFSCILLFSIVSISSAHQKLQ